MTNDFLLPDLSLCLEMIQWHEQTIQLVMSVTTQQAACPDCGQVSRRIHSHATWTPEDLPLSTFSTQIILKVRRFFCDDPYCRRKTFTEQVPALLPAYARRTSRLAETQLSIGLAAGGEAGARMTKTLRMATSPDTLLRLVRHSPEGEVPQLKAVGIDDWAIKKGKTYGTLIVNLETHRPIDLVSDRTAKRVATWLKGHPEIEVVSRDRSNEYAKGVAEGAPRAIQVADRWHLVKNLREALEQYLEAHRACLRAAAEPEAISNVPHTKSQSSLPNSEGNAATMSNPEPPSRPLTKADQLRQMRRTKRKERYQTVVDLYHQGLGIRAITRQLELGRDTVRRFVHAGEFPEMAQHQQKTPGKLAPYLPYLEQRWQAGCQNRLQLWREIQQQGFEGTPQLVYGWSKKRRLQKEPRTKPVKGKASRKVPLSPPQPWAASRAVWVLMKTEIELSQEEQQALLRMKQVDGQLEQVINLSHQFRTMVKQQQGQDFSDWLDRVAESGIAPLIRFAEGLKADKAAVSAALNLPWSNDHIAYCTSSP